MLVSMLNDKRLNNGDESLLLASRQGGSRLKKLLKLADRSASTSRLCVFAEEIID